MKTLTLAMTALLIGLSVPALASDDDRRGARDGSYAEHSERNSGEHGKGSGKSHRDDDDDNDDDRGGEHDRGERRDGKDDAGKTSGAEGRRS